MRLSPFILHQHIFTKFDFFFSPPKFLPQLLLPDCDESFSREFVTSPLGKPPLDALYFLPNILDTDPPPGSGFLRDSKAPVFFLS